MDTNDHSISRSSDNEEDLHFDPQKIENFFKNNSVWGAFLRRYLEQNHHHLEDLDNLHYQPVELPAVEISENSQNVKIIPILIPTPIPGNQISASDLLSLMKDNDDEITIKISRKKHNGTRSSSIVPIGIGSLIAIIGISIGVLISGKLPNMR